MKKINCGCTNDGKGNTNGAQYQDSLYGKGVRVCTPKLKSKSGTQEYTCTVCGGIKK